MHAIEMRSMLLVLLTFSPHLYSPQIIIVVMRKVNSNYTYWFNLFMLWKVSTRNLPLLRKKKAAKKLLFGLHRFPITYIGALQAAKATQT